MLFVSYSHLSFTISGTHFYLTLPSNASLDVFPDNKTSYCVKLPQSIDLEGNWEVCLYSVSYPNTWYTLQERSYNSMQELVKAVNKALAMNVNDNIKLTYNALNGKATVQLKNGYQLSLAKRMSIIWGFGGSYLEIIMKTTESPHVADLAAMLTIYVYCNVVQPQIVGDTNAQLLKSILVEGTFGDIITKTFSNIQYVPIQSRSFEDVEVLLRSDTGDPVPFERGKVVTTLHFRQLGYFT